MKDRKSDHREVLEAIEYAIVKTSRDEFLEEPVVKRVKRPREKYRKLAVNTGTPAMSTGPESGGRIFSTVLLWLLLFGALAAFVFWQMPELFGQLTGLVRGSAS